MTETIQQVTPEQLTGAYVMEVRMEHKLSRGQFATKCGWDSVARVTNIEKKDSWKEGNREAVARVINELLQQPVAGRKKGETGAERAARLDAALKQNHHHVSDLDEDSFFPFELFDDEPPSVTVLEDGSYAVGDTVTIGGIDFTKISEDSFPLAELPLNLLEFDGKIVSNSELQDWQRCRRKWWLTWYRHLLMPRRDYTGPREIGNRVHRALAAYYVPEGQTPTDPRQALERAIVEDWTATAAQYDGQQDEQQLAEAAVKFNESCALERIMIEGYLEWLAESGEDSGLRIVASETGLYADLEVTVDGKTQVFRAIGKIDTRVERALDGVTLLIDHKTVGEFTTPRKMLHMNPQMMHYILLAWLNSDRGIKRCDGALYNMLKKVKRTARANPPFFDRVEVHHNDIEMESYKMKLIGATHDILTATNRLEAGEDHHMVVYPTPNDTCSWGCDFFAVCPMFDDGSRAEDMLTSLYKTGDPLARYDGVVEEGSK